MNGQVQFANFSIQLNQQSEMKAFTVALVVVFIAAAQALTDEQKEKVKRYNKECLESSGVDPTLVTKGRNGEFVDDPKLKEYIFCFFKKTGFQNEAGDLQPSVMKAKLPAENNKPEVIAAIEKCAAIKKDTPQQTAYDAYVCYYESTHLSLY